jgi:hypothetical protein
LEHVVVEEGLVQHFDVAASFGLDTDLNSEEPDK